MADLRDVIEQLKANNKSEAGRDSTHTNEMRMSREANNQSFAELQEAITGTRSAIADQSDNLPSPSSLEETDKENASQTEKTNTLLQKIAGGIGGMLGNMKEKAKAVGKGFMSILKGTLFAGLFFALAKFFSSPLYQQMIDYIFKTLIPKLQFFYDSFFGEGGGFMKGFEALFSDDSGIGSIVLGLAGVTAIFAGVKMASMFKKLKGGVTSLLGFFKTASAEVGPLGGDTSKQKKGKDGLGKTKKGGGLASFGKSISSAGRGVGGFISGILKGIAGGLAAIAAPPVLIGLAAVSAAAIAIATAIRIMSPAFEPIGKMFESFGETVKSVFTGLRETIEGIGVGIREIVEGIGVAVGNVVDKISNLKTASTKAQTEQIKQLADIPADKLTRVADGVDRLKKALEDFGGGTFSQVMKGLFGGDGPLDKIVELTKKVDEIMRVAEAIDVLAKAGGQYEVARAELERRKRVVEIEKKIAGGNFRGFTQKQKDEEKAALEAELKTLKEQSIELNLNGSRNMGGRVKAGSMYLVNESGSELFIPDQPGMMMNSARTAQLMREGSPDRRASAPNITVNAPQDNKVTTSTSNTTANNITVGNQDPIIKAAMA